MDTPKRKVQMVVILGADTWEDAAVALEEISDRIHREGPIIDLCSGGCSRGYTVLGGENHQQTAKHYEAELIRWRNANRAQSIRDANSRFVDAMEAAAVDVANEQAPNPEAKRPAVGGSD